MPRGVTPKVAKRKDRWHLRDLLKTAPEYRQAIERMLSEGHPETQILAALPIKRMWVWAVARNPYPGGLLDPTAATAKEEGEWVDNQAKVQPWRGTQFVKKGGENQTEPQEAPQNSDVDGHEHVTLDPQARKGVIPFQRAQGSTAGGLEAPIEPVILSDLPAFPEPGPLVGEGSAPSLLTDEDIDDIHEPEPGDSKKFKKSGARNLSTLRNYTRGAMSIGERVKILGSIARMYETDPRTALAAIEELNELDGIRQAAKDPAANTTYSGPLFQLPKSAAVGLSPVGMPEPKPTTEDEPPPKAS